MSFITTLALFLTAGEAAPEGDPPSGPPTGLSVSAYGGPPDNWKLSWYNADADAYIYIYDGAGKAVGTLTCGSNPGNNETVTLGIKTYKFQTTLTNVDGNVLIGLTTIGSLANLRDAINLEGNVGEDYATAMTENVYVSAEISGTTKLIVTALLGGTGGNSIPSTETLSDGSWAAGTLAGGSAAIAQKDPGSTYYLSGLTGTGNFYVTHFRNGAESNEANVGYGIT